MNLTTNQNINQADIDIDFKTDFDPKSVFHDWTKASIYDEKTQSLKPHVCGCYPQKIPQDPVSKLSAIPYDLAESFGYVKLDFLHLSFYDIFSSRDEIKALLKLEPKWELLEQKEVVEKLFQLSRHFQVVSKIKPKSLNELADTLALIRPGKKDFIGLYLKDKESCRKILYVKDDSNFSFKKAHAYSYAMVIKLQLILIENQLL